MLLMKKEFFPAIRAGLKTTTLRYWRRRMVRVGSRHRVRGLGQVWIDQVRAVDLAELTDADARADGFADVVQLCTVLERLYPAMRGGAGGSGATRQLYQVQFTYIHEPPPDGGAGR
jgi:hypothetical protein